MLRFMVAVLAQIGLVILVVPTSSFAGDLSYMDMVGFERTFKLACEQEFANGNIQFEKWQAEIYCDCTARRTSAEITYEELNSFLKTKHHPQSVIEKRAAAEVMCARELLTKWGYQID